MSGPVNEFHHPKINQSVNENPVLQSLLYDANLLPEQIETKLQSQILNLVVLAFNAAREQEQE